MRILVHDFGGYPFPAQLSRSLARRGHTVLHTFCGSLQTTPQGALTPRRGDPESLTIESVRLDRPLEKFSYFTRWRQENRYGKLLVDVVDRFQPDVVLSGNAPLDAQQRLLRRCQQNGIRFAFWVQDLIGIASSKILRKKLPVLGALVGRYYVNVERTLLQQSDSVVLITDDFRSLVMQWGVHESAIHVIENWAPIDEIPVRARDNAWSKAHDLVGRKCLLYSGTLGMKHNPDLLLRLAMHFRDRDDIRVVVVSQGLGADWLAEKKREHGLENLQLLGFQPFEQMPDVFGSADILLAILEPDAGVFSVPSKVLAYLCAARPVLLAVPSENLAARIVSQQKAGLTVPPTDTAALVRAAEQLVDDEDLRRQLGRNARHYAEATFDIETITDTFEAALRAV